MPAIRIIENAFQRLANAATARWPRPMPTPTRLRQCKLISHRGDHGPGSGAENTLDAFQRSADAGVWGVELDVRWTGDGVPVVAHDPNLLRLHGTHRTIASLRFDTLQRRYPSIPALEQVVARFGGRLHFMIEIKQQAQTTAEVQNSELSRVLAPLTPAVDYHLLCMHRRPLHNLTFVPPNAKAIIAYHWPLKYSRQVINHGWAGLCGHYLLVTRAMLSRHRRAGQKVGTGFVDSRMSLFREIHRGIDWIFSNKAAELQSWIDGHRPQ
jgi:glycerophosphoryl diester phosphodiesterase